MGMFDEVQWTCAHCGASQYAQTKDYECNGDVFEEGSIEHFIFLATYALECCQCNKVTKFRKPKIPPLEAIATTHPLETAGRSYIKRASYSRTLSTWKELEDDLR